MRQINDRAEGRATLVVDEHKADAVGTEATGQPEDERHQPLALARASRAGHQSVRPIAFQIQLQRAGSSVRADAETQWCTQTGLGRALEPPAGGLLWLRHAQSQDIDQFYQRWQFAGGSAAIGPKWRQRARQAFGGVQIQALGYDVE